MKKIEQIQLQKINDTNNNIDNNNNEITEQSRENRSLFNSVKNRAKKPVLAAIMYIWFFRRSEWQWIILSFDFGN